MVQVIGPILLLREVSLRDSVRYDYYKIISQTMRMRTFIGSLYSERAYNLLAMLVIIGCRFGRIIPDQHEYMMAINGLSKKKVAASMNARRLYSSAIGTGVDSHVETSFRYFLNSQNYDTEVNAKVLWEMCKYILVEVAVRIK